VCIISSSRIYVDGTTGSTYATLAWHFYSKGAGREFLEESLLSVPTTTGDRLCISEGGTMSSHDPESADDISVSTLRLGRFRGADDLVSWRGG
jgi:hypothetical protein